MESVARPVQLVNNPVKAPLWKTTTVQIMHDTYLALEEFCSKNGYSKRDTIDVALREYLHLPEPT